MQMDVFLVLDTVRPINVASGQIEQWCSVIHAAQEQKVRWYRTRRDTGKQVQVNPYSTRDRKWRRQCLISKTVFMCMLVHWHFPVIERQILSIWTPSSPHISAKYL